MILIYVRLATVVNAVCVLADSRFGGQQDWSRPEEDSYNQGRTGFCSEEWHGLLWNIGSKYSRFTNQTTCSSVVRIALNSCIDWYLFVYRKTVQMLISHFSIYQNSITPCIRTRSNISSHLAEQLYKDLTRVKYSYRFTSIFAVIYGNSDLLATAFTMSVWLVAHKECCHLYKEFNVVFESLLITKQYISWLYIYYFTRNLTTIFAAEE